MSADALLFDATTLFFAAWIAIIAAVSLAAFRHDLFPVRARLKPAKEAYTADSLRPADRHLL
jgi:hypothetical protein